ncbi:hypothetical protein [Pimelobacter simplex]|uniref:hypothetical protein n=1 Tax=Nocardioides simplex TaxID=2045 RepID=UPI00214FC8BF|nr:hypothetical protein [Pimelobacter simplex]UUW92230.1 hypothetical protein M0M43_12330 [Pimelobacter simplex]UUW96056.1 hypothetical protein M0M48_00955 [Pimelobacter simplex]
MTEWRHAVPVDMAKYHVADTARATQEAARSTKETRELIEQLVEHSIASANAAEVRERQMLRWTQAGVLLAAIAAVASIIAIIVTIAVGG